MKRNCPICQTEYDDGGEAWKKICYPCYKEYKYLTDYNGHGSPIKNYAYKCDVYLAHPNVTKEQMDEWMKKTNKAYGWGAEEWKPENWKKFKIWVNNTNFD